MRSGRPGLVPVHAVHRDGPAGPVGAALGSFLGVGSGLDTSGCPGPIAVGRDRRCHEPAGCTCSPALGCWCPGGYLGVTYPFGAVGPGSAGRDRFSRVLPPGERTRAGRTVRVKCNGARTHARLAGARRAGPRIRCQALGAEAGPSPTQTLTHRPGAESPGPRTPPLRWVRLCDVAPSRPVLWHRGLGRACSPLCARPGVTRAGQPCADSPGGRAGGWAARCGRTGRPRRPGVPGLAEVWPGNAGNPKPDG